MKIQINSGHKITVDAAMEETLNAELNSRLAHFADRITRVELHLQDVDGVTRAGPRQILCRVEARLAGRQPDVVSAQAATVESAVHDAAGKMQHLLDGIIARAQGY